MKITVLKGIPGLSINGRMSTEKKYRFKSALIARIKKENVRLPYARIDINLDPDEDYAQINVKSLVNEAFPVLVNEISRNF